MKGGLSITVLAEDTAHGKGYLAEHGLAFWIEIGGRRILFDTGQGLVLEHNARRLGVDLCAADAIVISHGHYDHTGGLVTALAAAPAAEIFLHPAALEPKYVKGVRALHLYAGIPDLKESVPIICDRNPTYTKVPTEIAPGVHVTGEIPRENDFEDTGGPFYLDPECTKPDSLADDQALLIELRDGVLVVLGCAHAGTVNTLDYAAQLLGGRSIIAVVGGMHLIRAGQTRLDQTVAALKRYGVKWVGPCHCTGQTAITELRTRLPERCHEVVVGARLEFS
ncbi:MAG: MBL fold metallo-hydrolase [Candidatus Eisenbacteria sp.]|nr:MBL fold metallo-hydrolase [Candidatus Eisenbacteria bacterium]